MSITTTITPSAIYILRTAIPSGLSSALPGPKTTLTLYELSDGQGATGGKEQTWTGIQTLDGSLQPLKASEKELYNKQTQVADYKFIVAQSCFSNATNEAKLVEKNQLRYGTRKFNVIFNGARLEAPIPFYSVILKEVV